MSNTNKGKLFLISALYFLSLASSGFSQNDKSWMDRVATDPPGPYRHFRPMEVSYTLTWKGKINAGQVYFVLTQPASGVLRGQASGKSVGMARALYPYDFSGVAQTNSVTLKPLTFDFQDQTKGKAYKYSLQFPPNALIAQTDFTNLKTGAVTPYRQVFQFDKDTGLDMMSSLFYLRSQPLTPGQKVSLIVASFNRPYLADFTVLGREPKSVNGKNYNAIKMDIGINKIRSDMGIEPYTKVDKATVWISDDDFRIPLEFQGEIFVGYISAQLASRRWL